MPKLTKMPRELKYESISLETQIEDNEMASFFEVIPERGNIFKIEINNILFASKIEFYHDGIIKLDLIRNATNYIYVRGIKKITEVYRSHMKLHM